MIYYLLFFVLIAMSASCQEVETSFDILIKNGLILDGSNQEAFRMDLGIRADTIAFIGDSKRKNISATRVIDAEGYTITPGFIDPHTHASGDLNHPERKANLNFLYQGVTTVFVGSDGRSAVNLKEQFKKWERNGVGTNVISYVGHATVRRRIMGMRDAAPTFEEMEQMKKLVRDAMQAGAWGLSSGLYYAPASYATTEEVIALAKVAAEFGGNYDVHMRDESSYNIGLIAAVEETIRIADEAELPAHIAHIKCLGVDVWGKSEEVIRIIEAARSRGLRITADQYPYRASGSSITGALIPRWVLADDPDPRPKFKDVELRPKIVAAMEENMRRRGGPQTLLLTAPNAKNSDLKGLTLAQVAEKWEVSPIEAAIRVFENGGSAVGSFNMQEADMVNFMKQPWVLTGSDGSGGHPRKYGSFPKKIREYVMRKKVLSLKEMIHKSSGLTAQTFGIPKRGLIREGYFADIIVFNPEELQDKASFQAPTEYAEGMEFVLVNGQIAIDKGKYTGALGGRPLQRNGR